MPPMLKKLALRGARPKPRAQALKALRLRLRPLRRLPPLALLLCAVALFVLPLLLAFPSTPHSTPSRVIATTSVGTPQLSLPHPYGFSAPVMRIVLSRVQQFLRGGSKLSDEILEDSVDERHFHGWLVGHDPLTRVPDWTPKPFDFTKETTEMKRAAHEKSCYNKVRSDSLPLDRDIPDVRPLACSREWYYSDGGDTGSTDSRSMFGRIAGALGVSVKAAIKDEDQLRLPTTSVVFVFFNEPLSPLLRAVHSVLNRTPRHLLHEIILVDDGSDEDAPWLAEGAEFERHLQLLPKTRLARLTGRNGLMLARNVGASLATGETVTFLDSHIEVNAGWIEPLMGRIAEGERDGVNPVVVPVIDSIDADSFKYNAGGIDILGHTWGLGQTGISNKYASSSTEPMRSPIMAGGLLSLSRRFFDELGFYDPEMKLWGGEEMEISFRIWLCGGTLECMPCSRVGHVFRSSKYWQGQVYKVPGEVIARNKERASFWMDEYAQLSSLSRPPAEIGLPKGSMKHYEDIKKRLQCKPYRWYLENVYPEMLKSADKLLGPPKGRDGKVSVSFPASGFLRNNKSQACLDHLHHKGNGMPFGVYPCHYQSGSQSVVYTKKGMVMSGGLLLDGCLTRDSDERLTKNRCSDGRAPSQTWHMERVRDSDGVRVMGGGKCLTVAQVPEQDSKSPVSLRMKECGESAELQLWDWERIDNDVVMR